MPATAHLYVPKFFLPIETLHRKASMKFTEQRKIVFVKRHWNWRRTKFQTMKLLVYCELATSLNIGRLCECVCVWVWVCVCVSESVWVCVCVFECVTFSCDSHNIPPICLFWKLDIHLQFNTLPQLIFISWPDLCIS